MTDFPDVEPVERRDLDPRLKAYRVTTDRLAPRYRTGEQVLVDHEGRIEFIVLAKSTNLR